MENKPAQVCSSLLIFSHCELCDFTPLLVGIVGNSRLGIKLDSRIGNLVLYGKGEGERKMKRIVFFIVGIAASLVIAVAQKVTVEVKGVRNDKGNVLVMAQTTPEAEPVYGFGKAAKGTVKVDLEKAPGEKFIISVFHDENENWKMDMDEKHMPAEGYARESYQLKQDTTAVYKLKLFYPVNQ